MEILAPLPSNTGMAFVIISHMHPTAISHLALILADRTKMPVQVASQAMPIQPNHVYVIPPNADLRVKGDAFNVVSPRSMMSKQVDIFLISLAEAWGAHAIAVILSGYDGDGADGCKKIKANGGTTFAQDASAVVDAMPLTARATGCVDFVLPPNEIADKLQGIGRNKRLGG
jgi:two-component system CheB/CheR fusion protein